MLISIGDRESDIYELFLEANKDPEGPRLLVRAEKTRNRKVEQEFLWDFMAQTGGGRIVEDSCASQGIAKGSRCLD